MTDERQIELDDEVRQGDVAPDAATESEATPAAVSAQEPDTSFPDPRPDAPEPIDKTFISSTTKLPPDERPNLSEEPFEVPERRPMPMWALGVIVAAAAAIIVAVAIAFLVPPTLALDRVLMDFDATELESLELTNSVYASNDGYRLVGRQASGVYDDGTNRKVAHIEVAYSNRSFSVVVGIDLSYTLVDRQWVPGDYRITSIDATPTAPVDRDLALADVEKVLTKVAPVRGMRLGDIYGGGTYEVIDNELGSNERGDAICTTTFAIHSTHDLSQYDGQVEAVFQFFPGAASSDAGTWGLVSATATEDSWKPSLAQVEGTWVGTLRSTANTALLVDTGLCKAGETREVVLDVHGYDADTGRISLDVSFVAHNHAGIPEDAASTEGDVIVTLEDQVATLDPEALEGGWQPSESGGEQGSFSLAFVNHDGVWELQVTSGEAGSDGVLALGMTQFVDTYVLERG